MNKKLNSKELTLKDADGIDFISLVKYPAIELDFLTFKDDKVNVTLARVDPDKRIITGPALIPLKEIYRYDPETNEEYYVYFSVDTVKQISEQFLINDKQHAVNLEHEDKATGISLVESWIVLNATNDKAAELGYDAPTGTWMTSFYIEDDALWADIKEHKYNGFSIEGYCIQAMCKDSLLDPDDILIQQLKNLLKDVTV